MKPGKGLHHAEFTCEVAAYAGGMAPSIEITPRPRRDKTRPLPMEAGLLRDWYKSIFSMRALHKREKVSESSGMNFSFMSRF
jgi:hypothetical protein